MENDRTTQQPPAIRLPQENEKLSLKALNRPLTRREIVLCAAAAVLLLALGIGFILFAVSASRSPANVIDRYADETFQVQQELLQLSLPGKGQRSVLFYVSGDALACAVLEHKASGYKVQELNGHIPLTGGGKNGIWMLAGLKPGSSTKEFLVFGMLYDPSLTQVKVDGNAAVVVNTGEYRLWYYLGEGNASINSESVVYS